MSYLNFMVAPNKFVLLFQEMELMYAYRESVEVANTKLVDLEKSKVNVFKISTKYFTGLGTVVPLG